MPKSFDPLAQNQTMHRFLVAGINAVAELGVDNLSVQYVSDLAKGSRPTFYSYFGDINGLLAEIWVAKGSEWLDLISDPQATHSSLNAGQKIFHACMSEILAASHRISEISEVANPSIQKWWESHSKKSELEQLKVVWLIAERLGVTLTEPVDNLVTQADFVEPALVAVSEAQVKKNMSALSLPKLSDPVFTDTSLEFKLLQSAIYIIANNGVKAASMSRIARRTEVSTGSVYPRFANNQEIVEKSFELAISQVVDQNFEVVQRLGFSAEDFGSIIMAGLDDARKTWRNFRIEIHLGAKANPALRDRMRTNLRDTNLAVAAGLTSVKNPELAKGPVPYLMHAVGIGFAILHNAGLPVRDLDHRVLTTGITTLLNSIK